MNQNVATTVIARSESDEAIQTVDAEMAWIASLDRNDGGELL